MSLFSGKKIFLLGFIVVLLFAIPLTVFLTQQQQDVTSQAAPTTTLSFDPVSKSINVGDEAKFDIMMTPASNQVSFVKLTLIYDATKFSVDPTTGLVPNAAIFPTEQVLQGPTYSSGSISVSLSAGSNPASVISGSTPTKLATLTLKAIAGTSGSTTPIRAPKDQQQVLSIGSSDQANENVLASEPTAATVTIGGGSSSGTTITTNPPVCKTLVLDRAASGAAPYAVTLTASGTDSNGTITNVSFSFGDGKTSDVTTGGGIGTNSVNAQISHTYNNAGTFNAAAILTDNDNLKSTASTCAVTVTVTAAASGGSTGGSGGVIVAPTAIPTAAPIVAETTPILTVTPPPPLVVGPGDKIIGIGTVGIILSILGALLLAF